VNIGELIIEKGW